MVRRLFRSGAFAKHASIANVDDLRPLEGGRSVSQSRHLAIAICVTRQHSTPTPGRTGREASQRMGVQCQNPWRHPDRRASGRALLFESDGHLVVLLLAISLPCQLAAPPTHVPPFPLVAASSRLTFTFGLFAFFFLSSPILLSICFSYLVAPCIHRRHLRSHTHGSDQEY